MYLSLFPLLFQGLEGRDGASGNVGIRGTKVRRCNVRIMPSRYQNSSSSFLFL